MGAWKYEIYSSVEYDISRVSAANECDIIFNTRNKFRISAHPCIILYIKENYTSVPNGYILHTKIGDAKFDFERSVANSWDGISTLRRVLRW